MVLSLTSAHTWSLILMSVLHLNPSLTFAFHVEIHHLRSSSLPSLPSLPSASKSFHEFSSLNVNSLCNSHARISHHRASTTHHSKLFIRQHEVRLYATNKNRDMYDSSSMAPNQNKRKKKKNKYAKFSKVESNTNNDDTNSNSNSNSSNTPLDPFEALLAESEQKNKEIEKEKAMRRNQKVNPDLLDDETKEKLKKEKRQRNKRTFPDNKTIDPYDPTTYGYTELGTILGPHGVHGLVKVSAVTDFPERLCKPGIRHLKAPNRRSPREIRIVEGRHRLREEYLVKLEQVGDRNDAVKLRGSVLYARQEERPKGMDSNEYLITDLVGLEVRLVTGYGEDDDDSDNDDEDTDNDKVFDDNDTTAAEDSLGGKFVGIVGGIVLGEEMCSIPGLGQDLLEIVLPKGKHGTPSWRDELVLIPFVPQIIPTVDIENQVMYLNPPGGLLDLTYIKEEKTRIKGFLPEKSSWAGGK
jgi:ribosomal 30S subunit maturation factor RimM